MDKQKNLLMEAFVRKGVAISKVYVIDKIQSKEFNKETELLDELEGIYMEIGKFIDLSDLKIIPFSVWHSYVNGQYGRMTKYLIKTYEDKFQKEVLEELLEISKQRNWVHISNVLTKAIVTLNPVNFRLF